MNKINLHNNKTIKLQNVLCQKVDIFSENLQIDNLVNRMNTYISVKGKKQIGPLIQYVKPVVNNDMDVQVTLMVQSNNYINSVEKPYYMESLLRVPNCMYCRYIGPEEKLKFAYDKINLEAFEKDIELTGESYSVFVDKNEDNEMIIVDVFMPKKNEENE